MARPRPLLVLLVLLVASALGAQGACVTFTPRDLPAPETAVFVGTRAWHEANGQACDFVEIDPYSTEPRPTSCEIYLGGDRHKGGGLPVWGRVRFGQCVRVDDGRGPGHGLQLDTARLECRCSDDTIAWAMPWAGADDGIARGSFQDVAAYCTPTSAVPWTKAFELPENAGQPNPPP